MLTVTQTTKHLLQLNIDVADNRNIHSRGLGVKGLRLNLSGINILAKSFMDVTKKFLKQKGYSSIPMNKVRESEYSLRSDSTVLNVKNFNTNTSDKSLKTLTHSFPMHPFSTP